MQVRESGFGFARCEGMGITREVDTLLVGEQPPGTWLLVFLNSAREVLSEEQAGKISDAVTALDQVMQGDGSNQPGNTGIDHLFADLVDREIPKPDSLIALEQAQSLSNQHPANKYPQPDTAEAIAATPDTNER